MMEGWICHYALNSATILAKRAQTNILAIAAQTIELKPIFFVYVLMATLKMLINNVKNVTVVAQLAKMKNICA
jgi:hypothetical protein